MKLSTICFFIIMVVFANDLKAIEKEWATERPPTGQFTRKAVDKLQFIEVTASKLSAAISNLDKEIYQELTPNQVRYYTGRNIINYKSKYAILMRSVYMNGAIGQFSVTKIQDELWLRFHTFGTKSKVKKSALIVFVDSLPKNVYITTDTSDM